MLAASELGKIVSESEHEQLDIVSHNGDEQASLSALIQLHAHFSHAH
ncbi:MAG: hypothetical protein ACJ8AG_24340 [Ktedonobacteraceae bacterium]